MSGLHLAKYRVYNNETARWLSRDPIGLSGGANLYTYLGSPLQGGDRLGLMGFDDETGRKRLLELYPIMKAMCSYYCLSSNDMITCFKYSLGITQALYNTWTNYYGKGFARSPVAVGGWWCWRWAILFDNTVKGYGSKIWKSEIKRYNTKSGNEQHFSTLIYIEGNKGNSHCQFQLDDGFADTGGTDLIHKDPWPNGMGGYQPDENKDIWRKINRDLSDRYVDAATGKIITGEDSYNKLSPKDGHPSNPSPTKRFLDSLMLY